MTNPINPNLSSNESQPINTAKAQPTSANAHTAEAAASASGSKKKFSMDTNVGSVAELREKAPEVYDEMMKGIAFTIIKSMRRHMERIRNKLRESRRQ